MGPWPCTFPTPLLRRPPTWCLTSRFVRAAAGHSLEFVAEKRESFQPLAERRMRVVVDRVHGVGVDVDQVESVELDEGDVEIKPELGGVGICGKLKGAGEDVLDGAERRRDGGVHVGEEDEAPM